MPRLLALVVALALLSSPAPARANGCNTHSWITFHAIDHLPAGSLKELLTRPELQEALLNGSIFPDGGYVIDNGYGEIAHWEPFVTAYIAWMLESQPRPFNQGHAAELVAFLMGLSSHGMADQFFDATFMDAARIHDAEGWSETLFEDFDSATDAFLVAATGVDYRTYYPWVPAAELSALYQSAFDHEITPAKLESTQGLMHTLVLSYGVAAASDPEDLAALEARYPWGAANLMDASRIGSPPCEGEVVAHYMLALWDRLHEQSGEQNWWISTYPRGGSDGHPTDHTLIESELIVISGHGIRRAELEGKVSVVDSTGKSYPLEVTTQWGAGEANLIRIRPQEDWAEGETFTLTIAAGLTTLDGLVYDKPFVLPFTTRPGDPGAPTSDPTPHEGEVDLRAPDAGPTPDAGVSAGDDDDGGCGCRAGGSESAGYAGLVILALLVPRTIRSWTSCPRRGRPSRRTRC